jgi:arginine decarboxylase
VRSLTLEQPPLPNFSAFHASFRVSSAVGPSQTRDGDIRTAFFLSYDDDNCEYIGMADAAKAIKAGRELVSALFVIPYPPGFPILVPGQVVSSAILEFMAALDVREIHGFRPELGFRIFNAAALKRVGEATAARAKLAEAGRAAFPLERSSQTVSSPAEQQVEISTVSTTTRIES